MPDPTGRKAGPRASGLAVGLAAAMLVVSGVRAGVQESPAPEAGTFIPVRVGAIFGLDPRATTEEVEAAVVSTGFFPARMNPAIGRLLQPNDGANLNLRPAVISFGLWHSRFEADNNAMGRPILVDGQPVSILGVAPQNFNAGAAGWIWLPRLSVAGDDASAGVQQGVEGEWQIDFTREGGVQWPADQTQRPLSRTIRGVLTLAAVRSPACTGCLALRGLLRASFETMIPSGPPANLRLLPERRPGDDSRAVTGFALAAGRIQVQTSSGACRLCGEVAIDAAIVNDTASGNWSLETAAVSRPGDRGTVTLRRLRALRQILSGSTARTRAPTGTR
jgi:hypothetical protein